MDGVRSELSLTDVTRLNFFEVARAAFFSSPRHEVRSSARRTSPLTMVKVEWALFYYFNFYRILECD